jgi:hypothetical protein
VGEWVSGCGRRKRRRQVHNNVRCIRLGLFSTKPAVNALTLHVGLVAGGDNPLLMPLIAFLAVELENYNGSVEEA